MQPESYQLGDAQARLQKGSIGGATGGTRQSRNKKKHLTQEAAGQRHHPQAGQPGALLSCKLCRGLLHELEQEYWPCNCKFKICQKCFWQQVSTQSAKCPNCGLLYEVSRVRDHYQGKGARARQRKTRCESPLPQSEQAPEIQQLPVPKGVMPALSNPAPAKGENGGKQGKSNRKKASQAGMAGIQKANAPKSAKQRLKEAEAVEIQAGERQVGEAKGSKAKRNSSETQRIQQRLSAVRILQRNTLYVIGLSPNVAKEDTLRRFEYFGQYGRVQTVTINKEKAFQSENQGLCYSAYLTFQTEREASLAMLAVDQFVFDGRLLHASFGRTKYCRFFLKGTNCLNHDCPYLHREAHPDNILAQEEINKKQLFQQCHQLALKLSRLVTMTEGQFRGSLKSHKENMLRYMKLSHPGRIVLPQLEAIFDKKNLHKHCQPMPPKEHISTPGIGQKLIGSNQAVAATQKAPNSPKRFNQAQNGVPQTAGKLGNASLSIVQNLSSSMQNNASLNTGASQTKQSTTQDASREHPPLKQNRCSEGCNSEYGGKMLFGGRGRLQSSGTLGELDFQRSNPQNRRHQLIPPTQMRRTAQDDHNLPELPQIFQLHTRKFCHLGALPAQQPNSVPIAFQKQSHLQPLQELQQARNMQQSTRAMQMLRPPTLQAVGGQPAVKQAPAQQDQSTFCSNPFWGSEQPGIQNERARSGSQVAQATWQAAELNEVKARLPRRRKSSHSKFRLFDSAPVDSVSPDKKEDQKRFAEALREALLPLMKKDERDGGTTDSYEQFSSIFAGDGFANRLLFNKNNCSEGVAGGHVASPIRESILQSRRGSETRPRSQHSLIVESVARILDDTALEQRNDFNKQRLLANNVNFKTGPPSEVHQLMADEQHLQLNSHLESQWNHQFELNSSNSLNLPSAQNQKRSQQLQLSGTQNKLNFTSPANNQNKQTSSGGGPGPWHSYSLYNSPFFLIPTNTSNVQHRSAAFHDTNFRHLPQSNPFSLGQPSGGVVNDTWRLTYNPHPLLPGPTQSSNLSAGGGVPMLQRTTSQPFMLRSDQKAAPGVRAGGSQLEMHKQAELTQRNLEILNKKHCPSKDMLYAKIFTDFVPSSPQVRTDGPGNSNFGGAARAQHPTSVQQYNITPQSLFCFALDGEDEQELRQVHRHKLQKRGSAREGPAGLLSTPTRRKQPNFFNTHQISKVKEHSQTPTNKHSEPIEPTHGPDCQEDVRSHNLFKNSSAQFAREDRAKTYLSQDDEQPEEQLSAGELEAANQLANEASLGFGDLISSMMQQSRSRRSHHGTQMRQAPKEDEQPPWAVGPSAQRSRSQSYRDRQPEEHAKQKLAPDLEFKRRRDSPRGVKTPRSTDRSRSGKSPLRALLAPSLAAGALKQPSHEISQGTAASASQLPAKNFYAEFVKVQDSFRKSSGLLVGSPEPQKRRSSYSQGRNSSHTGKQLMEVTRRNSFKHPASALRGSMLVSPLELMKFKTHQIDEVNEDGATAKDCDERASDLRAASEARSQFTLALKSKSVSRSRQPSL